VSSERAVRRAMCAIRRSLQASEVRGEAEATERARCAVRRRRQTVMSWLYWTCADPRFLAMASSKGHIATFDWQAGKLNAEIQLREPVRDIK
jgi:hypothetical protein